MLSAADSRISSLAVSLCGVEAFLDIMAKESFKEILESYQHKSEGVYVEYPPSMRETTETMRRGCSEMNTRGR